MKPASLALAFVLSLSIALPVASAGDTLAPTLVEAQPDPTGEVYEREWVEFANPSPAPLDLDGLYLTDHDACFLPGEGFVDEYRWPLNATVPATSRIVLQLPTHCLNLANGGDDLALEDEQGNVLQSVSYGPDGDVDAPGDGESLSACHQGALVHGAWALAQQSPAGANQDCAGPSPATPAAVAPFQ